MICYLKIQSRDHIANDGVHRVLAGNQFRLYSCEAACDPKRAVWGSAKPLSNSNCMCSIACLWRSAPAIELPTRVHYLILLHNRIETIYEELTYR